MRDKAIVMLAASLLAESRTEQARELLKAVPVGSRSAVTAALLLADSWRIAGEPERALQWFLRIAAERPYHPDALSGLLAASDALAAIDREAQALALLAQVEAQAADAAAALEAFAQSGRYDLSWLQHRDNGLPASVRDQASEHLYRAAHGNLLAAERVNRQSRAATACLTALLNNHQRRLQEARDSLLKLDHTLAVAEQEKQQRIELIQSLRKRVTSNDLSPEQLALRARLKALINEDQRARAHIRSLQQNRDRLPQVVALTQQRLDALLDYYQQAGQTSSTDIAALVKSTTIMLIDLYRDLAGEAALRQASIREAHRVR